MVVSPGASVTGSDPVASRAPKSVSAVRRQVIEIGRSQWFQTWSVFPALEPTVGETTSISVGLVRKRFVRHGRRNER